MPKRSAEDILFFDTPSKRCYRSLCNVDMQLESMAESNIVSGGVNPPSLLALLGSRCRKRPYTFEDAEEEQATSLRLKAAKWDLKRHALLVRPVQTSGGFENTQTRTTNHCSKKRVQEDCEVSHTMSSTIVGRASNISNYDDCTFNSFQYWRVPLPELDLSLLKDVITPHSEPTEKMKVKDPSSDAMEM